VVFAAWVDPFFITAEGGASARANTLIDSFHSLLARHPDRLALVRSGVELSAAREERKLAGILGIEGGHAIEESLEKLEFFFERGVRVMTLVWFNHLSWIRSSAEEAGPGIPEGLAPFGVRVVEKMNELGMVVDLSHTCERSFLDAVAASSRPVFASHSGCRALHDHQRNITDHQLRELARNGGVIGIPFLPSFLDAEAAAAGQALKEEVAALTREGERENDTEVHLRVVGFFRRAECGLSVERLVDHIAHAAEVAGVEHVGLGSDFDGIGWSIDELQDASCYPVLVEPLIRRGFGEEELGLILGGNIARVFSEVTGGR
jgi:membrane dipeptidase